MTTAKYAALAKRWSDTYADPQLYNSHRAEILFSLGPQLRAGDRVLELACGDAGLAEPLIARGLSYTGVDASASMVGAARDRLGSSGDIYLADLNQFRPVDPVEATLCFRAIYYATDRVSFFKQATSYTKQKLVFDLNPRQYALTDVRSDLRRAGFDGFAVRPFFVPQTRRLPPGVRRLLFAAERSRPLVRLFLRYRFSYICAGFRSTD